MFLKFQNPDIEQINEHSDNVRRLDAKRERERKT